MHVEFSDLEERADAEGVSDMRSQGNSSPRRVVCSTSNDNKVAAQGSALHCNGA